MKFVAQTLITLALSTSSSTTVSAWSTPSSTKTEISRRKILSQSLMTLVATTTASAPPAVAGLLDEYGSDPSKIQDQKSVQKVVAEKKAESAIEPNLRSNYYYPTNKKRYLPRIKRCSDAIPNAAQFIGNEDWDAAESFAVQIADDTVLPMRLYTSSLTGGGTNVKVSYLKDMNKCADDFERNQKRLVKALQKRDREASSTALEGMAVALQTYREVGRLTGPDGGGDIPSTDEIRRAACRAQGRGFTQVVQARDERVKGQL